MVAAASYFVFFLFYDARASAPLLLTQTVAFFCYLLVPWFNRFGLRKTALVHAAVVAYANVLVLTWFLSTAAGIHLYFLGVALIVLLVGAAQDVDPRALGNGVPRDLGDLSAGE